jgi:polyhydroxyalkanoate synthesis regulator phasin
VAGFAVESARDLVQYMVRRGQMTQEEADRVIREAEEAHRQQKKVARDTGATQAAPAKKAAKKAATKSSSESAAKGAKTTAKKSGPAKKKSTSGSSSARAKSTSKTPKKKR